MTTAKTKTHNTTPLFCTWRSIEGCLFIYYSLMTYQEIFIKKYGNVVLELFLFELLHHENDCGDDLCDDEGCRSKKYFLQWFEIHKRIQKLRQEYDRAANSNKN